MKDNGHPNGCPLGCGFWPWQDLSACAACGRDPGAHGAGHPHRCLPETPDKTTYTAPLPLELGRPAPQPKREGPRVLKQAPPFLRTP